MKYHFWYSSFEKELLRVQGTSEGKTKLFDNEFYFHHGKAFYVTYREIFRKKIYDFNSKTDNPLIIDCGANMGLSTLYFSKKFPNSKIIAFEPDEFVLPFLIKNLKSHDITNVELIRKAAWINNKPLEFYTDKGMGGRLGSSFYNESPTTVNTVRLKDYLSQNVEMLKMDIEGAEYTVLRDCEENLKNVKHIFVEYHSSFNKEQHLGEILLILKNNGFRYHLQESFSHYQPFIDDRKVCEEFDMTINIFAYSKSR
jgi:FkbM family methyltransferase